MRRLRPRMPGDLWTVTFVIGLVLVTAWLTTRGVGGTSDPLVDATAAVHAARRVALAEGRVTASLLHRDAWTRELAEKVVSDHRAGHTPSMGWPDPMEIGAAGRDSILSALAQADLRPWAGDETAIGLHVVELDAPWPGDRQGATILGVHEGTPFCLRVVSVSDLSERVAEFGDRAVPANAFLSAARRRHVDPDMASDLTHAYRTDLLGGCTFVRRFGMPGDDIRAWLGARSEAWASARVGRFWVDEDARRNASDPLNVGSILTGDYLEDGVNAVRRACRAGDRAICMREFLPDGTPPGPVGAATVVAAAQYAWLTGLRGDLLGHLEREFGPEAFAAFWTSEAPLEVAFEEAFGVLPTEWAYGHATRLSGTLRAGPAPGAGTSWTSLLVVIGGLAVGMTASLRRRSG